MTSMQRRLMRSRDDDAAEVERVRALTLQRLARVAGPSPSVVADASVGGDTTRPVDAGPPDDDGPSEAATAAGVPDADEAIEMSGSMNDAPAGEARKPLVFRISGINEPAPTQVEPEAEPTPLVMFLGAPGPAFPADDPKPTTDVAPASEEEEPSQATLPLVDEAGAAPEVDTTPRAGAAPEAGLVAEAVSAEPIAVAAPAEPATVATVDAHAYCPYCATVLQPPPTSDRACSQCKQPIIVRHIDDRTVWLMEAALPVFDAERRRIADEERWTATRAGWLDLARAAGAPAGRVTKAAAESPTEAKVAAARGMYLSAVDRAFTAAARDDRWAEAARIRFDQALVLFDHAGEPLPEIPG